MLNILKDVLVGGFQRSIKTWRTLVVYFNQAKQNIELLPKFQSILFQQSLLTTYKAFVRPQIELTPNL